MVWGYDGQYNMGIPFEDQKDADDEHKLVIFQGQHAHIYIYQLIQWPAHHSIIIIIIIIGGGGDNRH